MAGAIVVVFVVEIRAIVRMDVLVDRTVVMSVAVRMIVGVARIGVLVGMHRAIIVLVEYPFFHNSRPPVGATIIPHFSTG